VRLALTAASVPGFAAGPEAVSASVMLTIPDGGAAGRPFEPGAVIGPKLPARFGCGGGGGGSCGRAGGRCCPLPICAPLAASGPKLGRVAGAAIGGGGRAVSPPFAEPAAPLPSSLRSRSIISRLWPSISLSRWASSRDFCSIARSWASACPRQASRGSTWAPGARMLVDLGLDWRSVAGLEPVSDTENTVPMTITAPTPASSRYWRRLTATELGTDSVIVLALPDHEEVGGLARVAGWAAPS
jgi:hypothetical protein